MASWNLRTKSEGRSSPLVDQSFSLGSLVTMSETTSSIVRRREGTRTILSISYRASKATNSSRSSNNSSGIITALLPLSSGPKISQTESTKPSAVFLQHVSPAENGYVFHIHSKRLIAARWDPATPLGTPVEPDV